MRETTQRDHIDGAPPAVSGGTGPERGTEMATRTHVGGRGIRTVEGPTDTVVVVGAGLGGLAAALHLAAAGREVTVLERERVPGGRAGLLRTSGYRFDTGPTVLTMPELLDEAFGAVGERVSDHLRLQRLDPAYRATFGDGSRIDVHSDTAAMARAIAELSGAREADGYLRFVSFAEQLFRREFDTFVNRNLDSPRDLLCLDLLRLVATGAFRHLEPKVGEFLKDPRVRRLFTFQAMYAGVTPFQALALYAVIAYLDTVNGVYFPMGGMHQVPTAMAAAAERHGVRFRYGVTVNELELVGDRVRAVRTDTGDRIPADAVVLNLDLPTAYRSLLPDRTPRRVRRLRYAPSCVVLHAGTAADYPEAGHHNLHFGQQWKGAFSDLIRHHRPMRDPSFLVTIPTRTDPGLAPEGRQAYYVLVPVPHLPVGADAGDPEWKRYRDTVVELLERRGYPGFGDAVEVEHFVTPVDWSASGLSAGTPFAAAHTFGQTGPFRPANLAPGLENVVFTGSGTHPGVGVPMTLISGRLSAQRITGSVG